MPDNLGFAPGGNFGGSGSAINWLHLSEMPKWSPEVLPIKDQLASLLQAVPDELTSVIVIEATASTQDQVGEFEARFRRAELSKDSAYRAVFHPWYRDSSYRHRGSKVEDLTAAEREWVEKYGVDEEQIAWYRRKLGDDSRNPKWIRTIRGVGYRFTFPDAVVSR